MGQYGSGHSEVSLASRVSGVQYSCKGVRSFYLDCSHRENTVLLLTCMSIRLEGLMKIMGEGLSLIPTSLGAVPRCRIMAGIFYSFNAYLFSTYAVHQASL